jgi:hypothetical protein
MSSAGYIYISVGREKKQNRKGRDRQGRLEERVENPRRDSARQNICNLYTQNASLDTRFRSYTILSILGSLLWKEANEL